MKKIIVCLGFFMWNARRGGMRRVVRSRVSRMRETNCRVCLAIRGWLIQYLEEENG
jgi:hypothetical protein